MLLGSGDPSVRHLRRSGVESADAGGRPAPAMATILYLGYNPDEEKHRRKLGGIRRYVRSRGWNLATVPRAECPPENVPALLAETKPDGCVCECSPPVPPPRAAAFGRTPVVWLDPFVPVRARSAATVACDNEGVARAAFRELSAGLPPCCGIVPSRMLAWWNEERAEAFRALCDKADLPCRIFPGKRGEDVAVRIARLAAWLADMPRGCGVFAMNDFTAGDVIQAAGAISRRIPRDLALVGVDGMPEGGNDASPAGLTSIQLDFESAGYTAARLLASRLDAAEPPCGPETAFFGPFLVLRHKSTGGRGRREPQMLRAVEMIRREAADGLTAAALTARFPGSRKHFEQRFREATGHSVLDEILHVRLEKVKVLLARTRTPLGAVAPLCGFGSDTDLRRLFHRRTGASLREWRKAHALRPGQAKLRK